MLKISANHTKGSRRFKVKHGLARTRFVLELAQNFKTSMSRMANIPKDNFNMEYQYDDQDIRSDNPANQSTILPLSVVFTNMLKN